MIRSVVVEDERISREILLALLAEHCPAVEVVAVADSVQTGVEAIRKHKPDLIFLDIEMPYGNAFDLLEQIGDVRCEVIFTTAFDVYAIRAIKICALDYLLKPIDPEELAAAVDRAENQLSRNNRNLEALIENLSNRHHGQHKIVLPTLEDLVFVQIDDIIRCEASGNYTMFHLLNGERIIVSKTLKEYDLILSDMNFFRVHHSSLININHVRKYVRGDGGYVVMCDDSQVTVSRRRKEDLLKKLSAL
jgi:two-component system LytT family response regulator